MFIPLHDANSLKHIKVQYVTIGLIAISQSRSATAATASWNTPRHPA